MTTLCAISDCHLGYMHRLKKERLSDYENAFSEAVKKAMDLRPEMIIFAGDMFHHPKPDARSMRLVINALLRMAGSTKIVLCVGNHEIEGHIRTAYMPLFSELHENIHVLTEENPHASIKAGGKKVGIHGFPYARNKEHAEETLRKVTAEIGSLEKNDVNILCLHQAIEGYLSPFEISIKSLKDASSKYDAVLIGHVHKNQRIEGIATPAFYVGSTERVSFNEAENRTGFLVFRDFDFGHPEFIEVASASMKRVSSDLGKKTPEEINSLTKKLIEENSEVKCLQVSLEAEIEGDFFDVKCDYEKDFPKIEVLSVNIIPKIRDEAIRIEKTQIDSNLIEEYFEKKGMKERKELKDLCKSLYEKYCK